MKLTEQYYGHRTIQGIGTVGASDRLWPASKSRLLQILHQRWNSCGCKWPNCSKNWVRLWKHHVRNVRPWLPMCDAMATNFTRVVQWSPKTQWPEAREVPIWGFRGVRVGEASNQGPASKRRHTQRLRALQ